MAFPHDGNKFQPGESGNPIGKPKGVKHLSTHIQDLLNDDNFTADIMEGHKLTPYKGAPVKAIVRVAAIKALAGDTKWAEWLGKYGYGTKQEVDVTSKGESIQVANPAVAASYAEFLKQKGK